MRLRALGLVTVFTTSLTAAPLALLSLPSPVSAQAAPALPSSVNAREAFRRGEAAYSAGNYETAVREWTSAYSADPRPRIQFNLSQAYERMGQLENAIAALKRFLESGDPEDPTYSDANARLVALQQRLASTGVFVQGGAEGGSIFVDGQDWGRTPRPDKITVTPGSHLLIVRWPSGREFRTNVYVPPGQVVEIPVAEGEGSTEGAGPTLPPATVDDADAPTNGPRARTAKGSHKVLWYSLGSGVAAAGVGLIVYGIVRGKADDKCGQRDSETTLLTYCNPSSEEAAQRQSLAGYITGGVLAAGGAALLVVGALSGGADDDARAGTTCGLGLSSAECTVRF